MTTTKKVIRRNLPLNETYKFISVNDMGDMNFASCYNCGKTIRYVAELHNSKKEQFYVGTECAKTLADKDIENNWEMVEEMNAQKTIAAANSLINNNSHVKMWGWNEVGGTGTIFIVGYTKSGKAKKVKIEKHFHFDGRPYPCTENFVNTNIKKAITEDWCVADVFDYFKELKQK